MASTSYNPFQRPIFDTSSDSSSDSSSGSNSRNTSKKNNKNNSNENHSCSDDTDAEDMTTTQSPSPHQATTQSTNATSSSRDEFLHALVRITSGRFIGLTGRIERIVSTGWVYIYDNPMIDRPVRWGDVEVLHDSWSPRHNADLDADRQQAEDDESSMENQTTPDVMGARIRIVNKPHAGLEGTIVQKLAGICFRLDVLPNKIVPLEKVEVVSLPSTAQSLQPQSDPVAMYTGATVRVKHDGIQGQVLQVIVRERYITDNAAIQKAYRRNQFVVLQYADGTVPTKADDLTNDDENVETENELSMEKNFPPRKRTRTSTGKDNADRSSLSTNMVKYPDFDNYSTDEKEDDIPQDTRLLTNDEDDSHSSSSTDNHQTPYQDKNRNPLLGVTVRVLEGKGLNHIAKITKVCSRGWWELEGLDVKVKSSIVHFVDDGTLDYEAIRDYYSKNHRGTRMPAVVKVGDMPKGMKRRIGNGGEDVMRLDKNRECERKVRDVESESESDDEMLFTRATKHKSTCETSRRKPSSSTVTGSRGTNYLRTATEKRMTEKDSIMQWGRKSATSLAVSTIPNLEDNKDSKHLLRNRGSSVPVLDPILVKTSGVHLGGQGTNTSTLWFVPEGLRHLPPDAKIEIFNRRTGRIMRGKDAIPLKDLPAALMEHSEYEPIAPPPPNTDVPHRIGRSGRNIRVSKSVVPQCRLRASAVEGKHVLVTGGEYRGLSGVIDSTLPGGWYVVSNLFKHDRLSLEVIVSSNNLELMTDKISWSQTASPGDDSIKTRIRLQASKLRLDALNEEKDKVLRSADFSNSATADVNLIRLESELRKVEAAIVQHQQELERSERETPPFDDSGLNDERDPHTIQNAAKPVTTLDTGHETI